MTAPRAPGGAQHPTAAGGRSHLGQDLGGGEGPGKGHGDVQGAEPWLGLEACASAGGEATGCPPGTASSWHPSSTPRHP